MDYNNIRLENLKGESNMIFNDVKENNTNYVESMTMTDMEHKDGYDLPRHWEVIDTITYADGKQEVRRYFNTVVNDCSKLIACLMKGQSGYSGIKYWAVGSGNPNMSNTNPDTPSVTDTKLQAETFRKAIDPANIVFLDGSNNVSATPTNKLQISITFLENEANGELREFGLFGGDATSNKDTGIMINRKIHPLIYKTSGMRLDRVIRISF